MKLRNQLLALACLLVFTAFGFVIFKKWAVQKPFGIILFVSDGLSTNTLTAARLYEEGAERRMTVETFPHLALVANYANDFAVPDSAAAATAIATGVKGNNRALAMDPHGGGKTLRSILALAHDAGRATGIVTTGKLTDATSAAFYAHTGDARDVQSIALQFLTDAKVDIAMGGGFADFTPESKGGRRKDGRDLWLELRGKGFSTVRTKAELENTASFLTGPLVGLFADGNLSYSSQVQSGSQEPSLPDMVRRAIEFLQTNSAGYLLVVDAALISRAAEQNNGERVLTETIDFDHAVATALEYAGDKALIVAMGKHDVGGMALNGYPLRGEHGLAMLGINASGIPAVTWSTGPNGARAAETPFRADEIPPPAAKGAPTVAGSASHSPSALPPAVSGTASLTSGSAIASATSSAAAVTTPQAPPEPPKNTKAEPAAFGAPEAINTARDMIAVGVGPGSEPLTGFLDNTEIFRILKGKL